MQYHERYAEHIPQIFKTYLALEALPFVPQAIHFIGVGTGEELVAARTVFPDTEFFAYELHPTSATLVNVAKSRTTLIRENLHEFPVEIGDRHVGVCRNPPIAKHIDFETGKTKPNRAWVDLVLTLGERFVWHNSVFLTTFGTKGEHDIVRQKAERRKPQPSVQSFENQFEMQNVTKALIGKNRAIRDGYVLRFGV